jgi:xylan 1,4-beta-xylosidase
MGGRRLAVRSSDEVGLDAILKAGVRGAPDVSALAALDGDKFSLLAWHYHDDDVPGPDAEVTIELSGLPAADGPVLLHHDRIDGQHSNAFEAWKRMGSPQQPTPDQYAELERAGQLASLEAPATVRAEGGKLTLRVSLPRQAVSLLRLDLRVAPGEGP